LANILAGPLVQLAPRLAALVRPGGRLILSGLLANQAAEVEAAYAAHFIFEHRVHDGWAMLAGQKIN
ncbi:MAG TPA: 50S ribosomal protein L11 methyltransferase, partial [Acidiferrobacterales bacterium]|nr:50S ribosomal protein L11 methyltransferase [Acidiferrobacterales bacterium]